jgi:hypothetical protein
MAYQVNTWRQHMRNTESILLHTVQNITLKRKLTRLFKVVPFLSPLDIYQYA